jgi:hypothetical protein
MDRFVPERGIPNLIDPQPARLVSKNLVNQKYLLGPKVLELADISLIGRGWGTIAIPPLKVTPFRTL